jgi:hypothetical protein
MRAGNTNEAVQMLNLLLEFFENGARWTRGLYQDGHGRRCLIGALDYLRREHRVPSDTAVYFLQEALPHRTFGLIYFNDRRCGSFAELRSVILKARALALGEAERDRAAAAVERWLLAALKAGRTARVAAGDDHATDNLGLRTPAALAFTSSGQARLRQAA